jgi:hypothetical protein
MTNLEIDQAIERDRQRWSAPDSSVPKVARVIGRVSTAAMMAIYAGWVVFGAYVSLTTHDPRPFLFITAFILLAIYGNRFSGWWMRAFSRVHWAYWFWLVLLVAAWAILFVMVAPFLAVFMEHFIGRLG